MKVTYLLLVPLLFIFLKPPARFSEEPTYRMLVQDHYKVGVPFILKDRDGKEIASDESGRLTFTKTQLEGYRQPFKFSFARLSLRRKYLPNLYLDCDLDRPKLSYNRLYFKYLIKYVGTENQLTFCVRESERRYD